MEKINSRNKIRYFEKFGFQMPKAICLLMLLGTFTLANAQCDLKLTEKIMKFLQEDKFIYLKDIIFEFDEVNNSKAYSFLLKKDTHYFLYLGVSENYDSEIEFAVTTGNTDVKILTVSSLGKISKVEITPTETTVYNIKARLTKGKKSCGAFVLGVDPAAKNSEVKASTDEEVYVVVDQMPLFVIGENITFRQWVEKNISGSDIIKRKGMKGKVYLTFVVNSIGDVIDVQVIKGIDPEIDAFFVDVLKKCPRWQPGIHKNKPVSVRFTIPISVELKP